MSIPPDVPSSSSNFDQFIRRNAVNIDSTTARLVSRGEGFAGSVEFADAISGGVAAELVNAVRPPYAHSWILGCCAQHVEGGQ